MQDIGKAPEKHSNDQISWGKHGLISKCQLLNILRKRHTSWLRNRPLKGKKALGVFGTSHHGLYQSLQEGYELFPLSLPLKPLACAKLGTSLIPNEKPETKQLTIRTKPFHQPVVLPGIQISALARLLEKFPRCCSLVSRRIYTCWVVSAIYTMSGADSSASWASQRKSCDPFCAIADFGEAGER